MKNILKNPLIIMAIMVVLSCSSSDEVASSSIIEGLTTDNYPKVDGSTSTDPLNRLIACKLFDYNYAWVSDEVGRTISCSNLDLSKLIKTSQTHQSLINLIDKTVDLSLAARKMSPDEKNYADAAGITLIETPIALDAFLFIVNDYGNPVQSLTIKQVQDIYTGKITNWKEVGGNDELITPYVRNANSGSQELMESLVMKDLEIIDAPLASAELIFSMQGALDAVARDLNSIGYTVYYYKEVMQRAYYVKTLEIEGIYPNSKSISERTYPLVAEVYASIRSDLDKSSMAYKLYEFLQTEAGKKIISESGYVPY